MNRRAAKFLIVGGILVGGILAFGVLEGLFIGHSPSERPGINQKESLIPHPLRRGSSLM
jgi:hypothetical protein